MKGTKIILFISVIFILGACSNNLENKDTTKNDISVEKIENTKAEVLNEDDIRVENIGISEFKKELTKNDSIIIDLRTSKELKDTGIISGAKQIDFYSSDFKEKLDALDKDKKYLIYCRSGGRSGQTLSLMKDLGFRNVLELQGGMNNWITSGEKTEPYNETSMMMDNAVMKNVVTLNAKKWEFDKTIIKAKKGEKLIIKVNNIDGLHGIAIPDMRIMDDNEIEVDTSKPGEYEFRCANYCGEGHQDMTGKIIIE